MTSLQGIFVFLAMLLVYAPSQGQQLELSGQQVIGYGPLYKTSFSTKHSDKVVVQKPNSFWNDAVHRTFSIPEVEGSRLLSFLIKNHHDQKYVSADTNFDGVFEDETVFVFDWKHSPRNQDDYPGGEIISVARSDRQGCDHIFKIEPFKFIDFMLADSTDFVITRYDHRRFSFEMDKMTYYLYISPWGSNLLYTDKVDIIFSDENARPKEPKTGASIYALRDTIEHETIRLTVESIAEDGSKCTIHILPKDRASQGYQVGNRFPLHIIDSLECMNCPVADGDRYGRYKLVDFWGTWCAPCLSEIPNLKELSTQAPDLEIVSVSMFDTPSDVLSMVGGQEMHWKQLVANDMQSEMMKQWVSSFPTYFLLDEDEVIIARSDRIVLSEIISLVKKE